MRNKVYSFLGLAAKAGRAVSGEETCERILKAGKAFLTLVAEDASDNTKKKFTDICSYRALDMRVFGEKELLGRYTGKEIRSVVCILDIGFARQLLKLVDQHKCESGGEHIVQNQDI